MGGGNKTAVWGTTTDGGGKKRDVSAWRGYNIFSRRCAGVSWDEMMTTCCGALLAGCWIDLCFTDQNGRLLVQLLFCTTHGIGDGGVSSGMLRGFSFAGMSAVERGREVTLELLWPELYKET